MVGQNEIMFRIGNPTQGHGNFLPASAHADSEREFDPVSEVDFSASREVKTEKLGIPGKAHGYRTEGIRLQVTPGIGELKIGEKVFPCSADSKSDCVSKLFVDFVGFADRRGPVEARRMNESNRGDDVNTEPSARG